MAGRPDPNDSAPHPNRDSPRWCDICSKYGDHHTDRHHLFAPRRPDTQGKVTDGID